MFIAKDKNSNRISINDIKENEQYFCELCNEEVFVWAKNSNLVATHFAHKRNSNCVDWSSRDMSEWHKNWQNQFPLECQEIVLKKDNIPHRADVLINNFVIEFQHSDISYQDFKNRNEFYTSFGYHVIWVFDANNKTKEPNMFNEYVWKKTQNQFQNFDNINGNIEVFFEVELDNNKVLLNANKINPNYFTAMDKIEIKNFILIITYFETLKNLQKQNIKPLENPNTAHVTYQNNISSIFRTNYIRGPKINYIQENRQNNYRSSNSYKKKFYISSRYRKR